MIFVLDVGSSKIVACVGTVDHEAIEIQGISTYYFTNNIKGNDFLGVRNGVICDLELIEDIVNQTLNEAKIEADCSVGSVITNISGSKVCSLYSFNKLELNNGVITADIMRQLIDTAKQKEIPSQYSILDYEVQEYLLDNEYYATNPLNLTVKTVQSNLNLFIGGSNQIENIKKILRKTDFKLSKIVPSGILSGMAVLNREEKELGCCLIDIGAGTTNVVVYENGFIRYVYSIPIGGEDMTRDLANVLKISRNLAEDLKLNYGGCSVTVMQKVSAEGINLVNHRGVNQVISRHIIASVMTERLKDIFEVVKTGLNKHKIYDIISSGIVITGGVAKLSGIDALASQYFRVPVRIGVPNYASSFADLVTAPNYATSVGGLYFAQEYMLDSLDSRYGSVTAFHISDFGLILEKFKKLFAKFKNK